MKCKQLRLGFELGSPYPFPIMITSLLRTLIYIYMCVRVCVCVFTQHLRSSRKRHIFLKVEFNRFEFRVFLLLDRLSYQVYYLPGERITGFMAFPSVLERCEMQSASSRIRTRVVVSISNYDDHYSMSPSTTQKNVIVKLSTKMSKEFFFKNLSIEYLFQSFNFTFHSIDIDINSCFRKKKNVNLMGICNYF